MEELQRLHLETKKAKEEKEKQKVDKKEALKNRLKKVRDRKRLKMGLPILPDDADDADSTKNNDEEAQPEEEEKPEDSILQRLKEIREKEEEARRKSVVREWDVGKKGAKAAAAAPSPFGASSSSILTSKPAETKVFSQKEWVEKKRSERPQEFAPPVNTSPDFGAKRNEKKAKSYSAVPPPTSQQLYEQHEREQWRHQREQPQPQFFPHQRQQPPGSGAYGASFDFGSHASAVDPDVTPSYADDEDSNASRKASISKMSRLEMHRQMNEGSFGHIVNEVTDAAPDPEPSPSMSAVTGSSRGVEIPPPCSFDYYTSAANKRSNWKGSRTR